MYPITTLPCTTKTLSFLVGKPIYIAANEEPSIEDIDNLHKLYLEGLTDIFETNKTKFGIAEDEHLEFI